MMTHSFLIRFRHVAEGGPALAPRRFVRWAIPLAWGLTMSLALAVGRAPAQTAPLAPAGATTRPASPPTPLRDRLQPGQRINLSQPKPGGHTAPPLVKKPTQPLAKPLPAYNPPPPTPPKGTVVLKPGEVPVIEFDTPVYDFGRVKAGGDIVHDFWFTNTGNGPLEIIQVQPS